MRFFDKKGKVIKNFNKDGIMYEVGDPFRADRFVYDGYHAKGFVDEGEEVIEEKPIVKKYKKEED